MNHIQDTGRRILLVLFSCFSLWCLVGCVDVSAKTANEVIYEQVLKHRDKDEAAEIANSIIYYSEKYQVDPILVTSLFTIESHFNQEAVSPAGAIGIAQLMPDTANWLGVNPYDKHENIEGGIRYLAYLIAMFKPNGKKTYTYAIAAYNAGPGAIIEARGVPRIYETRREVNEVGRLQRQLIQRLG